MTYVEGVDYWMGDPEGEYGPRMQDANRWLPGWQDPQTEYSVKDYAIQDSWSGGGNTWDELGGIAGLGAAVTPDINPFATIGTGALLVGVALLFWKVR